MAAGTGICAVTGRNVAGDLLAHITPATSTVATAVTITGPLKLGLIVGTGTTNTTIASECSDANYARQSLTAWNGASATAGNGSAAGFVNKTSNVVLTFGGSTGFAVAQSINTLVLYSNDATPVEVFYQNFGSTTTVPINNQYTIASGSVAAQIG